MNRKIIPHDDCDEECCVLDLDFSGINCITKGPKFYHSCVEETRYGLLFRILHYTIFDDSDYGHILALNSYNPGGVEDLYRDLCIKMPQIKTFVSKRLLSLPYKQYELITRYIGVDSLIDLRRKFNEGWFRDQEVSSWLNIEVKTEKKVTSQLFPIIFRLNTFKYGNSVLGESLIYFGERDKWRKIVSFYKPLELDVFDIQSIRTEGLTTIIELSSECSIEIEEE